MGQISTKRIHEINARQRQRYYKKTGFDVDISMLGKNTQTIVHPAKRSVEEIRNNVWLKVDCITFPDGNFTNVYDLYWNHSSVNLAPYIHSENTPYYLLDAIKKDDQMLAVINGAFFFLVDNKDREPKDFPFHFCIRDGRVMGLLSCDEQVLYVRNNELFAQPLSAFGTMCIGSVIVDWKGFETIEGKELPTDIILYNSGNSKVKKEFDPTTGIRNGFLDHSKIYTQSSSDVVDLVINERSKGELVISHLNDGGGTHFFDGLFILQMPRKNMRFQIGDAVRPLTIGNLDLTGITSGITLNKSVHDPYFYTPERISSRDARSIIAKDKLGNVHFVVFDGSKYVPGFKGISAHDVKDYFSHETYEWAYFLDGGSSSRIIIKDRNQYRFLANDLAFRRIGLDGLMWEPKRHRKLASSIALRIVDK